MGCWLYDHLRTRSNCICSQKNEGFGGKIYLHCQSYQKFGTSWKNGRPNPWKFQSTLPLPWNHEAPQRPGQGIQSHTCLQLSDQSPSGWQIYILVRHGKLGIWFQVLRLPATAIGSLLLKDQVQGWIPKEIWCLQHSAAILEVLGLVRKFSIELAASSCIRGLWSGFECKKTSSSNPFHRKVLKFWAIDQPRLPVSGPMAANSCAEIMFNQVWYV